MRPSEWLDEANGWASWRSYKAAFAAIGAGFAEFALVAIGPKWTSSFRDYLLVALPLVIAAGYAVPMFYVMKKYNLEDQPWVAFLARLGIKVVK